MKELTEFECPYCGCVNYNSYEGIDREILALTGAVLIECPSCDSVYSIEQGVRKRDNNKKRKKVRRR